MGSRARTRSAKVVHCKGGAAILTDPGLRARNLGVYRYGVAFLHSAVKTGSPLVRAYLLGHALELFLKTYLLTAGFTEDDLRQRFGHNLAKLFERAQASGLGRLVYASPGTVADVARFSEVYRTTVLRYFSKLQLLGLPQLPDLRRILRLAQAIEGRLEDHVRTGLLESHTWDQFPSGWRKKWEASLGAGPGGRPT